MMDAFGYELADFGDKGIVNDDGYSGKDLNRPGIQAILKDIHLKNGYLGPFFMVSRRSGLPEHL
jgi:hypothetical protein